jgi:hypothetical protein
MARLERGPERGSWGDGLAESYTDKAAKLDKTPRDYTWHHLEDGKSMMIAPKELHKSGQALGRCVSLQTQHGSREV